MIEVYRDAHDEDGVYLVYEGGDNGIYHLPGTAGYSDLIEVDEVPGDAIPLLAQGEDRPPTALFFPAE